MNWITHFAVHVDPAHHRQWRELMAPVSTGLIMRSLKADFKFVRSLTSLVAPLNIRSGPINGLVG